VRSVIRAASFNEGDTGDVWDSPQIWTGNLRSKRDAHLIYRADIAHAEPRLFEKKVLSLPVIGECHVVGYPSFLSRPRFIHSPHLRVCHRRFGIVVGIPHAFSVGFLGLAPLDPRHIRLLRDDRLAPGGFLEDHVVHRSLDFDDYFLKSDFWHSSFFYVGPSQSAACLWRN
jgi:hypothetical protein